MSILREKAYKLLYEKYNRLYVIIRSRAENVLTYGKSEDAVKVLQSVVNEDEQELTGIISKTDKEAIRLLEYLLDDSKPIK